MILEKRTDKLFTQFADVVGNDSRLRVHVCMPGKGVQCAGNEQLGRKRQPLCFGFRLHLQQTVKVLQRRRCAFIAVANVGQVHLLGAAAEDGLFFRGHHAVTNQLLEQRQHKLRLADDRITLVTVGTVHIQRVDVGVGRGRNADDLAAEGFGQIAELTFRVENENVILGGKRDLHDFFLGAHTLAGAGNTQTETVAIQQQPPIRHDHVLADGVLPIVQTIRLHDFLCPERNQYGGAFGGKGSQGLDFPQPIGQHRVQPVFLLPAQRRKLAQVLARRGVERFGVAVQLFLAVSQMHECHKTKHHPLVAGRQIVQHLLGFLALQFHIVRNGRGKIIVGVLAALPVGDIRLHAQQCTLQLAGSFVRWYRQNVDRKHQIAVKVAELRHKAVLDVAGIVLQIQHPAIPCVQLEMVGGKFHAVGAEPILEILPALGVFVNVELCRSLLSGLEKVAENVQALGQRQLLRHRGKLRKMRHQIRADTGKVAAGFVRVALYHAYGQIAFPHNAVAGAGDLCGQHLVEFVAVFVQTIIPVGQQDAALELGLIDAAVVNRDFGRCAGVESIQQFRVIKEHTGFVLFAGDGVVDVGKRPRLGILVADLENSIRKDAADGNGILYAARNPELFAFHLLRF